jgi:hypothetical protein
MSMIHQTEEENNLESQSQATFIYNVQSCNINECPWTTEKWKQKIRHAQTALKFFFIYQYFPKLYTLVCENASP